MDMNIGGTIAILIQQLTEADKELAEIRAMFSDFDKSIIAIILKESVRLAVKEGALRMEWDIAYHSDAITEGEDKEYERKVDDLQKKREKYEKMLFSLLNIEED